MIKSWNKGGRSSSSSDNLCTNSNSNGDTTCNNSNNISCSNIEIINRSRNNSIAGEKKEYIYRSCGNIRLEYLTMNNNTANIVGSSNVTTIGNANNRNKPNQNQNTNNNINQDLNGLISTFTNLTSNYNNNQNKNQPNHNNNNQNQNQPNQNQNQMNPNQLIFLNQVKARTTQLFYKILTNESMRLEIFRHIWGERSKFSGRVSSTPLTRLRYSQIISAEWICDNGYYTLLADKLKTHSPLVFNERSIVSLCAACKDMSVFQRVFKEKREYFSSPTLIEKACEGGNIEVVQYLLQTGLWQLNLTCVELAVRKGHVDMVQFIQSQTSIHGSNGHFQLLVNDLKGGSPPLVSQQQYSATMPAAIGSNYNHLNQSVNQNQPQSNQNGIYGSPVLNGLANGNSNGQNGNQNNGGFLSSLYNQQTHTVSIPTLFCLALQCRSVEVAKYLFDRVGFFLTGPVEGMFMHLCLCGDLDLFKKIYESFKLVIATSSIKEYHKFIVALLDYSETPITQQHFKIIEYIERPNKVAIPPIKQEMNEIQIYSLFVRWAYLNKPKIINDMSNSILRSAVTLGDVELFKFAHKSFTNAHPSRHLTQACQLGRVPIVVYLLENEIEQLTPRDIQLAYFNDHQLLLDYFRANLNRFTINTEYHYRKSFEYRRYPKEILELRATYQPQHQVGGQLLHQQSNQTIFKIVQHQSQINLANINNNNNSSNLPIKITDPLLNIISSPSILTTSELQTIFQRSLLEGDRDALDVLLKDNLVRHISITRSLWQIVAKIGDIEFFESILKIHLSSADVVQKNRDPVVISKAIATRMAVDSCIWGQLTLFKYLIEKYQIEMDCDNVEYMTNSATFNGNANIACYLLDNYQKLMSRKQLSHLMKHATNYKHFDLVKLYHNTYSIPINKKLLLSASTICNLDSLRITKKKD